MAIDTLVPRSRRNLLTGVLGGLVGAAAATLAGAQRALGVGGDDGTPVLVGGQYYDVRTETVFSNSTDGTTALSGRSQAGGYGLVGFSDSGTGVYGTSDGIGVVGTTNGGIGVLAGTHVPSGVALKVDGRLVAGRISGRATIAKGKTSVAVAPGVDVRPSSFILLTPQVNLGGRDLWFTTNPAADSFTIHLSGPRPSPSRVAWLLLG